MDNLAKRRGAHNVYAYHIFSETPRHLSHEVSLRWLTQRERLPVLLIVDRQLHDIIMRPDTKDYLINAYSVSINHLYRTYLANKNTPSNRQTSPNTEYTNSDAYAYIRHDPTLVPNKFGNRSRVAL